MLVTNSVFCGIPARRLPFFDDGKLQRFGISDRRRMNEKCRLITVSVNILKQRLHVTYEYRESRLTGV